jgi:hypothetical protein
MKTRKTIISAAVALTVLLASTGAVFAQNTADNTASLGTGVNIDASLDEYMIPTIAEVLGMSVAEVTSQYDAGSTFTTIALAQGVPADEITALLQTVRAKAIEMAVADGKLTAEEAEWLQNVQQGGNARGGMSRNRSSDLTACVGTCDYTGTRQYQNPMVGSSMGRGGRR